MNIVNMNQIITDNTLLGLSLLLLFVSDKIINGTDEGCVILVAIDFGCINRNESRNENINT